MGRRNARKKKRGGKHPTESVNPLQLLQEAEEELGAALEKENLVLVDNTFLDGLIKRMCCKECKTRSCSWKITSTSGLPKKLTITCSECQKVIGCCTEGQEHGRIGEANQQDEEQRQLPSLV